MRYDLIIDGYNLMHAAGLARERYAQGDLERCRTRLLSLVRHSLTQKQRANTTIVFDGHRSDGYGETEFKFHGMLIIFSNPQQEADDVIEILISEHSFPKRLKIISSDHRLHKAGRTRRAEVLDSEVFLQNLERKQKQQQNFQEADAPPEKPSEAEVEKWLEEFGDINISKIEADLEQENRQADQIRQEEILAKKKLQKTRKPKKTSLPDEVETELEANNQNSTEFPIDLEFWENRIAELDQEEL